MRRAAGTRETLSAITDVESTFSSFLKGCADVHAERRTTDLFI